MYVRALSYTTMTEEVAFAGDKGGAEGPRCKMAVFRLLPVCESCAHCGVGGKQSKNYPQ